MMVDSVDLAVIIVTWNTRQLVLEAIHSLLVDLEDCGVHAGVYVVDCASTDGTVEAIRERYPSVKVYDSPTNLGFAGGNNLALRALGFDNPQTDPNLLPKAVYLLNPDTVVQKGSTAQLLKTLFAHPMNGVVGAKLVYGDGSFQHSAFYFPGLRQIWSEFFPTAGRLREGRFNGRYDRRWYEEHEAFEVDFVLGATMMMRREVILKTGLFDEAFFVYCEEVDWAWRIRKAGYAILTDPRALVVHYGGQSTTQVSAQSQQYLWESRLILYRKHYPQWKYTLAKALVRAGIHAQLRRLARGDIQSASPERLRQAYQHILELAR